MRDDYEIKLIDTNILVYAYDNSEKEKHEIAKNILAKCWRREITYALSTQNLSELFVNVTRKIQNPVPINEIEEDIVDILSFPNFKIFIIKPHTIVKAIYISSKFNIPYWDSLLVSIMQENNINIIITENESDFKKIPWLEVINPFKK